MSVTVSSSTKMPTFISIPEYKGSAPEIAVDNPDSESFSLIDEQHVNEHILQSEAYRLLQIRFRAPTSEGLIWLGQIPDRKKEESESAYRERVGLLTTLTDYANIVNSMLPPFWDNDIYTSKTKNEKDRSEVDEQVYRGTPLTSTVIRGGRKLSARQHHLNGIDPNKVLDLVLNFPPEIHLAFAQRILELMNDAPEKGVTAQQDIINKSFVAKLGIYIFTPLAKVYELPGLIKALQERSLEILDPAGYRKALAMWAEIFMPDLYRKLNSTPEEALPVYEEIKAIRDEISDNIDNISNEIKHRLSNAIGIPIEKIRVIGRLKPLNTFLIKLQESRNPLDWLGLTVIIDNNEFEDDFGHREFTSDFMRLVLEHDGIEILDYENTFVTPKSYNREYLVLNTNVRIPDLTLSTPHLRGIPWPFELRLSLLKNFKKNDPTHPWLKLCLQDTHRVGVEANDFYYLGDYCKKQVFQMLGQHYEYGFEETEEKFAAIKQRQAELVRLCTFQGRNSIPIIREDKDFFELLRVFSKSINAGVEGDTSIIEIFRVAPSLFEGGKPEVQVYLVSIDSNGRYEVERIKGQGELLDRKGMPKFLNYDNLRLQEEVNGTTKKLLTLNELLNLILIEESYAEIRQTFPNLTREQLTHWRDCLKEINNQRELVEALWSLPKEILEDDKKVMTLLESFSILSQEQREEIILHLWVQKEEAVSQDESYYSLSKGKFSRHIKKVFDAAYKQIVASVRESTPRKHRIITAKRNLLNYFPPNSKNKNYFRAAVRSFREEILRIGVIEPVNVTSESYVGASSDHNALGIVEKEIAARASLFEHLLSLEDFDTNNSFKQWLKYARVLKTWPDKVLFELMKQEHAQKVKSVNTYIYILENGEDDIEIEDSYGQFRGKSKKLTKNEKLRYLHTLLKRLTSEEVREILDF